LAFLRFQRQDELEADYLGLQYVYKAGYSPGAYAALLARLAPKDAASQSSPDAFRCTPPVSERIAQANKEIGKILPNPPPPKSSPEFVLMKSRL
jgi:beta-barrel assembly-enhancing protease